MVGAGTTGLSSLPLLKVTTALTSSILAFRSLDEPISSTPLRFCCVWEGNFPFSEPCCWLDNLEIFEHSTPFVPPQTFLPLCLNLELRAQQEKKVEATAVVLLRGHMQGVLASMIGLDDSSNWGYRCYHKVHL